MRLFGCCGMTDLTAQFIAAASRACLEHNCMRAFTRGTELDVGELLHDADYDLYESITVVELMDAKMDPGA